MFSCSGSLAVYQGVDYYCKKMMSQGPLTIYNTSIVGDTHDMHERGLIDNYGVGRERLSFESSKSSILLRKIARYCTNCKYANRSLSSCLQDINLIGR